MQLVLSNNRVLAHGENFISMGGTVINTETNKVYQNATVAECDGCPSDIDTVGYEYHAGDFVPCAPYGAGDNNGYVMEVCTNCAAPRNSGIPIRELARFSKIASATADISGPITDSATLERITFPVSTDVIAEYSTLRYKIKAGSYIKMYGLDLTSVTSSAVSLIEYNSSRKFVVFEITGSNVNNTCDLIMNFEKDTVIPVCFNNAGYLCSSFDVTDADVPLEKRSANGRFYDAQDLVYDADGFKQLNVRAYKCTECDYHITVDLEGRI